MARFCKNCGTSIPEGASFCPKCGSPSTPLPSNAPYYQPTEEEVPEQSSNPVTRILNLIDNGTFFRTPLVYLYKILGVLCLIPTVALLILIFAGSNEIFRMYASGFNSFVLLAVVLVAGVFSCLLWFNRSDKLEDKIETESEMVVIPLCADLIQTAIECAGFQVMLFCPLYALYFGIIGQLFMPFGSGGMYIAVFGACLLLTIVFILVGYMIILSSHYVGESIRAIAVIVNDLRKISKKK